MSWDGFLSYDGVLYSLPAEPPVAGSVVQVRERQLHLRVFAKGSLIATLTKRPRSQEIVQHPDQFSPRVADRFCAQNGATRWRIRSRLPRWKSGILRTMISSSARR